MRRSDYHRARQARRCTRPCRHAVLCLGLCLALSQPALAELYQFIDRDGTVHVTNVPTDPRFQRIYRDRTGIQHQIPAHVLEKIIARNSQEHKLHPALLRAVIKAESDFNPIAVSRAGAMGLMQLMPETAVALNVQDSFDPEQNVAGGAKYLRQLLNRFGGDLLLALAAYNAGERVVERYKALPPIQETQRYVSKVFRYYRIYLAKESASLRKTVKPAVAWKRPRSLFSSTGQSR